MTPLDPDLLAERTMAVERHFRRVAERLPDDAAALADAATVPRASHFRKLSIMVDFRDNQPSFEDVDVAVS